MFVVGVMVWWYWLVWSWVDVGFYLWEVSLVSSFSM